MVRGRRYEWEKEREWEIEAELAYSLRRFRLFQMQCIQVPTVQQLLTWTLEPV